jgi:DNA-binding CsgD family transcriptional regulator
LSRREQEILAHLLNGASPREIADRLHLSMNTIRSHRRRIEAKLGLHI